MTLGALFLVHTLWIKEVNRPCFFFFWETSTNVLSFLNPHSLNKLTPTSYKQRTYLLWVVLNSWIT